MRSVRSDATWLMPYGRLPRSERSRWSASSRSALAWERSSRSSTFNRAITAPARGINTDGLTELLVLPLGPLRAKAGEWALERWSYPDIQALRDADIGMAITGWARESSQFGDADTGPGDAASSCGDAVRLGQLLQHVWRVARPRTRFRSRDRRRAIGRAARRLEPWLLAEPSGIRSRDHREIRDDRWHPAYGGRDRAGRLSRPLPLLSIAGIPAVHSPGAAPTSEGESESSRRQDCRLGANPRPTRPGRRPHAGERAVCRRRYLVWRSDIPHRTNSRRPQSSRTTRWVRSVVRRADA